MNSQIDLHVHTSASDGTDAPEYIADILQDAGVRIFAVTDHDTIDGSLEAVRDLPAGMLCFHGVEFTCMSEAGRCHILGYDFDPEEPIFQAVLEKKKVMERQKTNRRISYLRQKIGVNFTHSDIEVLNQLEKVGKKHLARLMMSKGYQGTIDEIVRRYIDPVPTSDLNLSSGIAIAGILEAGGIPVWAHPFGETGQKLLTREQFHAQLHYLTGQGIRGIECFYSRYSRTQIQELIRTARDRNLLISGGSDYRGEGKEIEPGELNAEHRIIPEEKLTLLAVLKKRRSLAEGLGSGAEDRRDL